MTRLLGQPGFSVVRIVARPSRNESAQSSFRARTELCSWSAVAEIGVTQEFGVSTLLLIILVLLLIGALPTWPYSSGWGYYPSGGLGLVLIILLILVLMGR